MECVVCMNYYEDDIYSTHCGHLFCKQCANKMTEKQAGDCWTCQSPIQANSVHKIYLPARIAPQKSINSSQELTKEEIIKTMLIDLEIECEKNVKQSNQLKDAVDVYAMNCANFDSLNEELKCKNKVLEAKLTIIQQKLDHCEKIVAEFEGHRYNTRFKKKSARPT